MNKRNNVQEFCQFALIILLGQAVLSGCAGEIRHDGSKTYTLGRDDSLTASYASNGNENTKTFSSHETGASYTSQQDGISYSSQEKGRRYSVEQYDDATAHYTVRPGELPPLQFKPKQRTVTTTKPSVPAGQVKKDVRIVLEISNVLFDFDKWIIKEPYYTDLNSWADYLLKNPNIMAEIQGHTDSTGPEAYNQKLSLKRARTVINYLRGKGVAANRLTVKGFGESRPKVSNSTKEGQQKNRRVEMHY